MDFITLFSAIGGSGLISGLVGWLTNRRMAASQANNSDADYAEKIITQADKRVEQYEADAKRYLDRLTETDAYAKEQRTQKRMFRDENAKLKVSLHDAQLKIKDLEHERAVSDLTRCTVFPCTKAVPPRPHNKPSKQFESQ